jgi:putative ABC transport system permease protein
MEEVLGASLGDWRFYMQLLGIFASVAILLAAVGIYGVMSYSVHERTHEIGIRVALGAQPSDVLKLVAKVGSQLTCIGVVVGAGSVAFLACYIPARRATKVDPMVALRYE